MENIIITNMVLQIVGIELSRVIISLIVLKPFPSLWLFAINLAHKRDLSLGSRFSENFMHSSWWFKFTVPGYHQSSYHLEDQEPYIVAPAWMGSGDMAAETSSSTSNWGLWGKSATWQREEEKMFKDTSPTMISERRQIEGHFGSQDGPLPVSNI